MERSQEKKYLIEISHRTVVFTIVFLLLLKLLWQIKNIIFSLIIAFIIMSALKPFANLLVKLKLPRSLAVIIIYFLFILSILFLFYLIIPPLAIETGNLFRHFPYYLNQIVPDKDYLNLNFFTQQGLQLTSGAFNIVKTIFSNIVFVVSTLFFSIYFTLEENLIKKIFVNFLSSKKISYAEKIFLRVENRLKKWFWGELVLMTIIGILSYIGLTIINIPYAIPLAVLAGLLEVVPNIGPFLSTIPAAIIGLAISPIYFFAVIALYFIIQQAENNLIVPLIMKKAVNLNPIITLFSLLVGGQIAGVIGIILSVPIFIILETILLEFINLPKKD